MLAVLTSTSLNTIDAASLKQSKSQITNSFLLKDCPPTCSIWAQDNSALFFAAKSTISKFTNGAILPVHQAATAGLISHILATKATLIFAQSRKVHVLDGDHKISQTFDSHKATISSISLANDDSLLASTSESACHVYNLLLGSNTILRGLPSSSSGTITCCAFHPHNRTRLLIGSGIQLLVYDTTRPSSPLKSITVEGKIIAVACSPYSKTLVAVATTTGTVGLIDLEKETGLFRSITVHTPLSSIAFSACGAFVYLGTENGKLLVLDLRALDKTPKELNLSDSGERVVEISVQKKLKNERVTKVLTTKVADTISTSKASPTIRSTAKPRSTVAASLVIAAKPSVRSAPSTAARIVSTASARAKIPPSPRSRGANTLGRGAPPVPKARVPFSLANKVEQSSTPTKSTEDAEIPNVEIETITVVKSVLSAVRDPLGNANINVLGESTMSATSDISVQMETWAGMRGGLRAPPSAPTGRKGNTDALVVPRVNRERTESSASRAGHSASSASSTSDSGSKTSANKKVRSSQTVTARVGVPLSAASISAAPSSHRSNGQSRREKDGLSFKGTGTRTQRQNTRTPSPDLPAINDEPMTPVPVVKSKARLHSPPKSKKPNSDDESMPLNTPGVDAWIDAGRAGKGKEKSTADGRSVGFKGVDGDEESEWEEEEKRPEEPRERKNVTMAMQLSPRRGPVASTSYVASPLRHGHAAAGQQGQGASPHELLRSIVSDVMYDFRQETRTEMTGLHLDIVRMGHGWKRELKSLMEEYVGDLRELREENERLRLENENLRRGY